jgi:hypothetical protein
MVHRITLKEYTQLAKTIKEAYEKTSIILVAA